MKLNPQLEFTPTGVPFVGYIGAGSRLSLKSEGRGVSIQQTLGSQMWIILSLLAMIVVPGYALLFDRERIAKGVFSYAVLGIVIAIGVPFFIKYSLRLFGRRRIFVDPNFQKISFYSSGTTTESALDFSSIASLHTKLYIYRSDGMAHDNFIVVAIDRDGKSHELCVTDDKSNAADIETRLSQVIALVSVT
jgi:hypothetical protein